MNVNVLCSNCHHCAAIREAFAPIIDKFKRIKAYQIGEGIKYLAAYNKCWETVNESVENNIDKICSNWMQHKDVIEDIYFMVLEYFGNITNVECMKVAHYQTLVNLLNAAWDMSCINTFMEDGDVKLFRMKINRKEFEDIKQNAMYKKYVLPNTKTIGWDEFKQHSLIKEWSTSKHRKIVEINQILQILQSVAYNDKFGIHAIVMKLGHFLHDKKQYEGECIIFSIQKDQEQELEFFVVQGGDKNYLQFLNA